MKQISVPLRLHFESETTTVATCWKITLTNSNVYGFTDHDTDLIIDGLTYEAEGGYTATDVQTSAALNVDNLEVEGMLNSTSITDEDLFAGLWDYAAIQIFQVNWRDLTQGRMYQRVGTLGEVSLERGLFRAELRGLMQAYSRIIGRLTAPGCDAIFGDARCGFDVSSVTFPATVLSVSSDNSVIIVDELAGSPSTAHEAGYYDYGLATWVTGANAGYSMEIKRHLVAASPPGVSQITLVLPMPRQINSGSPVDEILLRAGCAKRFEEDCKTRWDNAINFRGFPHLPGPDKVIQIARSS